MTDPEEYAHRLAAASLAAGDPTGWFEQLYADADAGRTDVPWDRGTPNRLLAEWASTRQAGPGSADTADSHTGQARRAVVVGCGLGADAEFVAGLGYDTTAFDISATAVRSARRRFPDTTVEYAVADLLHPPDAWRRAFDLVVESITVQSMPVHVRRQAIGGVAELVAPGGTLLVIARSRDAADEPDDGPPWLLTRADIDTFTDYDLHPVRIEHLKGQPGSWRAEFRR